MSPIAKNILAVIAGLAIGSMINMGIIMLGSIVMPPPEGADTSTMEKLKETMHLFESKHFVFPFLGHALGTLIGALVAATIAATHKLKFALGIGVLFLIGGIANAVMLPAPTWFVILDVVAAYLPMAALGGKLGGRKGSA